MNIDDRNHVAPSGATAMDLISLIKALESQLKGLRE